MFNDFLQKMSRRVGKKKKPTISFEDHVRVALKTSQGTKQLLAPREMSLGRFLTKVRKYSRVTITQSKVYLTKYNKIELYVRALMETIYDSYKSSNGILYITETF